MKFRKAPSTVTLMMATLLMFNSKTEAQPSALDFLIIYLNGISYGKLICLA